MITGLKLHFQLNRTLYLIYALCYAFLLSTRKLPEFCCRQQQHELYYVIWESSHSGLIWAITYTVESSRTCTQLECAWQTLAARAAGNSSSRRRRSSSHMACGMRHAAICTEKCNESWPFRVPSKAKCIAKVFHIFCTSINIFVASHAIAQSEQEQQPQQQKLQYQQQQQTAIASGYVTRICSPLCVL